MIRYSHVCLLISCEEKDTVTISDLLGVQPSRIRESKSRMRQADGSWEETIHYCWLLDSPKGHSDGNPTFRLQALADVIEPFAPRLPNLRPKFNPFIDIVYHVTPQHSHGVTGEFDWFQMPAQLMRRFAAWDLSVSYETFWFNHPDWAPPPRGWWKRLLWNFRRNNAATETHDATTNRNQKSNPPPP